MNQHRLLATTALALPLAFAPLAAQAADVVETLKNSQQFSMFADALEKAGLAQSLQGDGTYTIFAPTDEAFQKMSQSSGGQQQAASSQSSQSQGSSSQSGQQQQAASGQPSQSQGSSGQSGQQQQAESGQSQGSGSQSGQQGSGSQSQLVQQLDSQQLKQVVSQHIIEGQKILADDLVGKEQKVSAMSGDELTVDGTGTTVVLVPTGLSVARVGDEVFIRREVAAAAVPAVTVSPTTGQQSQSSQSQSGQQSQSSQQSGSQQSDSSQSGSSQQSGSGQEDQQASSQSSGQGQSGQDNQPIGQQQGVLRAATVVEPDLQADNGVIHAIDEVIVPEKIEQQLMSGQKKQSQQQG